MSAIVGIYYLNGQPVDRTDLKRMVDKLAHRGPDLESIWHKGSIGLGHRMLWTTPESLNEKLPIVHTTGKLVITADARIDNRDELITMLNLKDKPAGDITDSELILDAYEKWGEQCPEKLIGDFVFAIWDAQKQKLFCARDPMGVKLFHYYHTDRIFVFASEIKAIFCLQEVSKEPNELMIAFHLARIFEDRSITFYRNIYRLPAAYTITIKNGKTQLKHYYSFDPTYEIKLSSDEEYTEAFRQVFTEAVRCRIRSAFPIGSTLSGGLDSSSIACTAKQLLKKEKEQCLHTFSAIFPSLQEEDLKKIDEREYINSVISTGDIDPHFIHADRLGPLTEIRRLLWHMDEALIGPNMYMHWALYNSAKQQNIRVFLDGIDGDTTVSYGLDYITDLLRTLKWKKLITEAKAFANIVNSSSPWKFIWRFGCKPLIPENIVTLWKMLRGRKKTDWITNTAINNTFVKQIKLKEHIKYLSNNGSVSLRTAREKHWHSLNCALHQYALEMLDKTAAAFSLEARYPYFDRRLIEFCLALPPEQKFQHGWTRAILRRSMSGILPEKVQWRKGKANLNPNFQRKLLDFGKPILEEVILKKPEIIERYVDIPTLQATYCRYTSQPVQNEQDALTIYGAVTLALWLNESGMAQ
jgi:asparagine synthase (glutamine-hydrolysing)